MAVEFTLPWSCRPQVAKAVSQALNNCMNCLPGQRDVDMAIRSVLEGSKGLMSGKVSLFLLVSYSFFVSFLFLIPKCVSSALDYKMATLHGVHFFLVLCPRILFNY